MIVQCQERKRHDVGKQSLSLNMQNKRICCDDVSVDLLIELELTKTNQLIIIVTKILKLTLLNNLRKSVSDWMFLRLLTKWLHDKPLIKHIIIPINLVTKI